MCEGTWRASAQGASQAVSLAAHSSSSARPVLLLVPAPTLTLLLGPAPTQPCCLRARAPSLANFMYLFAAPCVAHPG